MFEILIIWAFIYFFVIKKKTQPKEIYDINWKLITKETGIVWKIFKAIWILISIWLFLFWWCFLICILSI